MPKRIRTDQRATQQQAPRRTARAKRAAGVDGRVRIIGGQLRGRYIDVPDVELLRPTPARVRETLFNWLQPQIEGAHCLDLFAGSGALGIEALSRGAAQLTLVDSNARLVEHLRGQLKKLDQPAHIVHAPALQFLANDTQPYDVIFLDPPYADEIESLCTTAAEHLRAAGLIYCERDAADGLPTIAGFEWYRQARAAGVSFGLLQREN